MDGGGIRPRYELLVRKYSRSSEMEREDDGRSEGNQGRIPGGDQEVGWITVLA